VVVVQVQQARADVADRGRDGALEGVVGQDEVGQGQVANGGGDLVDNPVCMVDKGKR